VKRTLLAGLVLATLAVAQPASAEPSSCTRVMGFSVTNNWYKRGNFETLVDGSAFELLWQSGADLRYWSDPGAGGWSNAVYSPCGTPSRVILQVAYKKYATTSDPVIASALATVLANIADKWGVTDVELIPIVGGPGDAACYSGGVVVDSTLMHPRMVTLIGASGLPAGPDLLASACSMFRDDRGHLTSSGAAYVAGLMAQ